MDLLKEWAVLYDEMARAVFNMTEREADAHGLEGPKTPAESFLSSQNLLGHSGGALRVEVYTSWHGFGIGGRYNRAGAPWRPPCCQGVLPVPEAGRASAAALEVLPRSVLLKP